MKTKIFDFKDYKLYLNRWIATREGGGRGMRTGLAQAAGCQVAYVSQVLSGTAEFSLEQADALNSYLGHSKEEAAFFLLMVQYCRAGTASLKAHYREHMQTMLEKRMRLKEKTVFERTFAMEEQPQYFSAWSYAAVHVCLTIPSLRTKDAIAKHLRLPKKQVAEVLEFLSKLGLAKEERHGWMPGPSRIHLEHDSPLISMHHINWRLQAIQSLEMGPLKNLHYSSVVSISREDIVVIKDLLNDALARSKAIVKDSKEEGLHCLSLDFFEIDRSGQDHSS